MKKQRIDRIEEQFTREEWNLIKDAEILRKAGRLE